MVEPQGSRSGRLPTVDDQTNPRRPERSPTAERYTLVKKYQHVSVTPCRCVSAVGWGRDRASWLLKTRVQGSPLASVISQICPKAPTQAEREEGGNESTDGKTEVPGSQLTWAAEPSGWETTGAHSGWGERFYVCLHFGQTFRRWTLTRQGWNSS